MSKEKLPPEEGKDKGYIEISLPNLSGIKDKLDEGLERIEDALDNSGRKYMTRDIQAMFEEGRVGLSPTYARAGYAFAVLSLLLMVVMIWLGLDVEGFILTTFGILLSITLIFLGKYEIRYDDDGFSTCIGKKELHRYAWSAVTDVVDKKKVFVNGKRLFADPSMYGFDGFYRRARAACKGKGKPTPPSEKKRKNRKKAGK